MKILSTQQRAKVRFRIEVMTSAILATTLVSLMAFLTSPMAYGFFAQAGI